MKTASFFTHRGDGRVSIARYAPRGTPAGFRIYKALAPDRDMLKMEPARYVPRYRMILGALDPQAVWDDLHRLAGDAEPVLLCWEQPPFSEKSWCHRRMVADWFRHELGQEVEELGGHADAPFYLRAQPAAETFSDDISPWIGRQATIDGQVYRVDGPDPANPGQAIIVCDDGSRFSVTRPTLEGRFGRR